jgi:hypothetical protein
VTGLSRAALQGFSTTLLVDNNQQPILPRCRPELLDCTAQLSLYLFFIGSTMGSKQLYLIFGLVLSVCNDVVNKITGLVVKKQNKYLLAKVKSPIVEEMALFPKSIQAQEPRVDGVGLARNGKGPILKF